MRVGYITYNPGNGNVYAPWSSTLGGLGWVAVINATTGSVLGETRIGYGPDGIGVDGATGDVLVSNYEEIDSAGNTLFNSNVSVISRATGQSTKSIQVGWNPYAIAYDPADHRVFVPNSNGNGANFNVTVIGGANESVAGSLPLCNSCAAGNWGALWDGLNHLLYLISNGQANPGQCTASNLILAVNVSTAAITARIPVGCEPDSITLDPGTGDLYVANAWSNNSTVIDGATNRVVGAIPGGMGSAPVANYFDAADGYLFTLYSGAGNLSVVDPSTDRQVANISGLQPASSTLPSGTLVAAGITSGGLNGYVFVTSSGAGTIAVVSTPQSKPVPTSVTVGPPTTALQFGQAITLTATATCTGGPCPPSLAYSWSMNVPLGTLSAFTGSTVTFTAGATAGSVTLFVNATLNGATLGNKEGPIAISSSVPVLESVSVTPTTATLASNMTASFSATAVCSTACPSGLAFAWSASDPSLGGPKPSTGPSVSFRSSERGSGSDTLAVNASWNGVWKTASATITVQQNGTSAPPPRGFLGLPGIEGYVLVGGILAAVAVMVVLVLSRRRATREMKRGKPKPASRPPPKYQHKERGLDQNAGEPEKTIVLP